MPKVKECIAYIESCGWEFMSQKQYSHINYYNFYNPNAADYHKYMCFTLTELRHAKRYGW